MPSDTRHFAAARRASRRSTCVRGNKTGAVIVHRGRLIGRGASVCSPNGEAYGEPIVSCPRKAAGAGTGERYELCSPIHAEEAAIIAALKTLAAKAASSDLRGAILYLTGHYYACWRCAALLRFVGITDIRIDPETALTNPDCHHRPPES
ncbi:MAG: hypothetical protein A2991_00915 [Candidatus Terrybacteria bacterium RIFCSPLOWO2_01_FULL_58_14]|uniref:CMP/dCMP-type deaminase domain-containing protein n=1 Tax=Candidatus Terrybacteria bacterium RIFCSPLOWO2_01_FULL_58_14 TaxID=1802369 RepID=A0A1G2PZR3_9BACT|nr:MAG: hypothetical protein A2991_00915 [Candidatus Terrybacteria bacterium RIFCSPLOWO2_01_FULL_58_14]